MNCKLLEGLLIQNNKNKMHSILMDKIANSQNKNLNLL